MADDLDQTLAFVDRFHPTIALCEPGSKAPLRRPDDEWQTTTEPDVVRAHVAQGGNVALMTGKQAGLAVFDPDRLESWEEITRHRGLPAAPWVQTGSGRHHYYAQWEPDLPAKLRAPGGFIIGEIQRGGPDGARRQAVMLPPSRHPNGTPYRWVVDPAAAELAGLSAEWRRWLWDTTPPHLRLLDGRPYRGPRVKRTLLRDG